MEEARKFHGYPAPGLIIGGYMVELARSSLPEGVLFDALSETVQCLPDAVQMLTPCTVGNGWLRIRNFGIFAVTLFDKHGGEGVRVHLDVDKLEPWPEIRAWMLKEKTKAEQDSEKLQREIREAAASILTLRQVRMRPEVLRHKSKGRVAPCPLCGDWHPTAFGGICRSCQGESPYENGPGLSFTPQPPMRAVPVEEAVGQHALHDMTRIIPGKERGAAFKAGRTLGADDVSHLRHMGRNRVYTLENAPTDDYWVHEDDAARHFALRMPGSGVALEGPPSEGKVNFKAASDGLLSVDVERLERFNLLTDVICATRRHMSMIRANVRLAAARAIPLYLPRPAFIKASALLEEGPLFSVLPLRRAKVGILVTGTEIYQGITQDKFVPIITQKAHSLECVVVGARFAPDEAAHITRAAHELIAAGADLIITTAGLSVDPDDVTRKALRDAGLAEDALYGMPVLPGAMTLVGRIGDVQVLGVPACALFHKTTGMDLLLPRLLAGASITRRDLSVMGNGGLCMECKTCDFPKCPFGR